MASRMFVEKSIQVNKPQQKIFDFLKYCKNQEQFSVWNMADPQKKTSTVGTDGAVGFVYSWDSKDKSVGAGSQEIKKLEAPSLIEYELRFERPMKNIASSEIELTSLSNTQTTITWRFSGPTKFPMSLFKGIFQKMLGKDLAKSLDNLKQLLEK